MTVTNPSASPEQPQADPENIRDRRWWLVAVVLLATAAMMWLIGEAFVVQICITAFEAWYMVSIFGVAFVLDTIGFCLSESIHYKRLFYAFQIVLANVLGILLGLVSFVYWG